MNTSKVSFLLAAAVLLLACASVSHAAFKIETVTNSREYQITSNPSWYKGTDSSRFDRVRLAFAEVASALPGVFHYYATAPTKETEYEYWHIEYDNHKGDIASHNCIIRLKDYTTTGSQKLYLKAKSVDKQVVESPSVPNMKGKTKIELDLHQHTAQWGHYSQVKLDYPVKFNLSTWSDLTQYITPSGFFSFMQPSDVLSVSLNQYTRRLEDMNISLTVAGGNYTLFGAGQVEMRYTDETAKAAKSPESAEVSLSFELDKVPTNYQRDIATALMNVYQRMLRINGNDTVNADKEQTCACSYNLNQQALFEVYDD